MTKPNIVIPTIRNNDYIDKFFNTWKHELTGCHIIIVEDRKKKQLSKVLKKYDKYFTYDIYDWNDIDNDLKEKSWIIPRNSDCVRSYGYYKAWQNNATFILTLDDDVSPYEPFFVHAHYNQLFNNNNITDKNFFSTLKHIRPRGTPKELYKQIGINHGMWTNVLDLDAKTQLLNSEISSTPEMFNEGIIPIGCWFSMCGMNLSWRTELTPFMYFGLQGKIKQHNKLIPLPIDRCGDIWCGLHAKQELDSTKKYLIHTGKPYVIHNRASNVWNNLEKETNAERYTNIVLGKREISTDIEKDYFNLVQEAYKIWRTLFNQETRK